MPNGFYKLYSCSTFDVLMFWFYMAATEIRQRITCFLQYTVGSFKLQ